MPSLEPAQFLLNAPDLAGRKVNVLYDPGLAERPPTPAVYILVGVCTVKNGP